MNIDELKALLAAGKITKEQFTAMAKALDPDYQEAEPTPEPDKTPEPVPDPDPDIEKMVQRAVDRATNKLGNENKKLRQQLDALKKAKLTEDEAADLNRQEREEALAERERALQEKENRLYAIKTIKAAGLDDGSDTALELVDFVMGSSEEDIQARVKAFGGLVKKFVKAEVDKTFKQHGRDPEQGTGGSTKNPWAKDTYNITQQMQLELTNPELAKQLKAAAGVK